jgi:hypothetical protein
MHREMKQQYGELIEVDQAQTSFLNLPIQRVHQEKPCATCTKSKFLQSF